MNDALANLDRLLDPIVAALRAMDPNDPEAAARVAARFPLASPPLAEIAAAFARGVAQGWLCDRQGAPGIAYSRVRRAAGPRDLSIDAVRMDRAGPGHTHPNGEFDLCFAADGAPRFDGHAPGWVVYPAGSWHVPTVTGGTMNILYFLPGGAIDFTPRGGAPPPRSP